ncbi:MULTISPECIES: helix-turn-helix domain-containing protein [Aestuariibaculum]|uniref:Helix-turn-helix domain-containing protein n=2 Tax=Aestuariibaculum TaxID=1386924 RepID=A0A8J6U8D3_9FLAO|nr:MULTISPECIES: helix-turn-helix domain-containing protein [Aestuariibaculum]MBD0831317.1 helix-turn-helix domain-containing protein [Aestuariibaculum sediminum]MCH4552220.1 helix-turn-helix domain-containing protein [Aestuariibaculum lutulentum]
MRSTQVTIHNITPEELSEHISNVIEAKLKTLQLPQQNENQISDDLLTVEETLQYLKCSKQALYNWRKSGILPSYRLGNRVYYKKSDILAKLKKQA